MKPKSALLHVPDAEDQPARWPARIRISESGMGGTGGGGGDERPQEQRDEQPLNLTVGAWFRFIEGDQQLHAQLAWCSPGGALLIFTDGHGERVKVLPTMTARYMLRSGTLRVMTAHTL